MLDIIAHFLIATIIKIEYTLYVSISLGLKLLTTASKQGLRASPALLNASGQPYNFDSNLGPNQYNTFERAVVLQFKLAHQKTCWALLYSLLPLLIVFATLYTYNL